MTEWFRSWHGAPTDTKWLAIARRAGVAPGIVSAVVWALLDTASQATERGSISSFDVEAYAAFSGFDETHVQAVVTALEDKGVIREGVFVSWERRQPKREDNSTERVRRYRERNAVGDAVKRDETHCDAPEKNRTEQNRTEKESKSAQAREHTLDGNGKTGFAAEFDAVFWPEWRHKVSPAAARRAFIGARQAAPLDEIMAGVRRYQASKPDWQEWAQPAGWLDGERWKDEPAKATERGPPANPSHPVTWVAKDDPRWDELAALHEERHGKRPNGIETSGHEGVGWYFEDQLVAGVIPQFLRRTG